VRAISNTIRKNSSLREIGLQENKITRAGMSQLKRALGENTSLLKLAVLKNPGSDEDMMREIKDCLKINKKLKRHNGKGSKQAFHKTLMNFE